GRRGRGEQAEGEEQSCASSESRHQLRPLLWPREGSGSHLRRIFTRSRRVGLSHLILRNGLADAGARTGVSQPARMGLVGCDGVPKIALREQGLFPIKRSGNRRFLSALVASGTPRHGGIIAPTRFMLVSR